MVPRYSNDLHCVVIWCKNLYWYDLQASEKRFDFTVKTWKNLENSNFGPRNSWKNLENSRKMSWKNLEFVLEKPGI